MDVATALLSFSIAAALLTITPGLDTALVPRTAAVEGPRRAMLAGAGVVTGVLAWGLIAALGSVQCWPYRNWLTVAFSLPARPT